MRTVSFPRPLLLSVLVGKPMDELQTTCSCAPPPPSLFPRLLRFSLLHLSWSPTSSLSVPRLTPAAEPGPCPAQTPPMAPQGPVMQPKLLPPQAPVTRCPRPDGPSVKPPFPVPCAPLLSESGLRLSPPLECSSWFCAESCLDPKVQLRALCCPDSWRDAPVLLGYPAALKPSSRHGPLGACGLWAGCITVPDPLSLTGSAHGGDGGE